MAKTWEIEKAKPADAAEIQKLLRTVWLKTYPNKKFNITTEDIESKKFLSSDAIEKRKKVLNLKNEKRVDFVIRAKDGLKGWCAAERKKNFGQIMTLYVRPDFQDRGMGMNFMKKALKWLNDYDLIVVEAAIYNKRAIGFYKKFGFGEMNIKAEYKFPNGKTIPTVVLERKAN